MLYYLAIIGVAVVIIGTCYTVWVMNKQQYKRTDLTEPSSLTAQRPIAHNPIVVLYIVIPILAAVLGILAWLAFE